MGTINGGFGTGHGELDPNNDCVGLPLPGEDSCDALAYTVYAKRDAEVSNAAMALKGGRKEAKDSLGDRMKSYEGANRHYLTPKMPVILRVDGRAFHTYVRGTRTPFDDGLMDAMDQVAVKLCTEISGAQLAYVQSDEISVLLTDYKTEASQQWFGGNIQKMVSVSAALAAVEMTMQSARVFRSEVHELHPALAQDLRPCTFDSRVFCVPKDDVVNYFIWRQQDWTRNSLQMLSRAHFSHAQLNNKNQSDMHEMLHTKGVNWADLAGRYKNGRCIRKAMAAVAIEKGPLKGQTVLRPKWFIDHDIPVFTQNRNYVTELL